MVDPGRVMVLKTVSVLVPSNMVVISGIVTVHPGSVGSGASRREIELETAIGSAASTVDSRSGSVAFLM
jgi:hypothetical protein